ncbi:MAG: hypothetical protein KDN22_13435 [Verrucomicrobiae bacterium]|nr:hypothetical protein [Verrucomicrobiae bacterium]
MRSITTFLSTVAIAAVSTLSTFAEDGHDHEKKVAGPNGGRVITSIEPHVEFFVTKDRKVQLTFLDENNKAKEFSADTLKLTGGKRLAPTQLSFAKSGNAYVSDKALPDGKAIPVVLQIKLDKKSKKVTEKFNVDLSECPSCDHLEYACICAHGDDGHDHEKEKADKK